jgi:hypothetical protein
MALVCAVWLVLLEKVQQNVEDISLLAENPPYIPKRPLTPCRASADAAVIMVRCVLDDATEEDDFVIILKEYGKPLK